MRPSQVVPVQDAFDAVELHAQARARQRLDICRQVMQQGLYLAPVDIGVDRIVEDRAQQALVLVAHADRLPPGAGSDRKLTARAATRDAG